jgi:hypothetical protein
MRKLEASAPGMAVVASSSVGAVSQIVAGCSDLPISHLALAGSWGGVVAGESRAMASVMAGDGDVNASLPC